jgi:hypothetical protein
MSSEQPGFGARGRLTALATKTGCRPSGDKYGRCCQQPKAKSTLKLVEVAPNNRYGEWPVLMHNVAKAGSQVEMEGYKSIGMLEMAANLAT